MSDISTSEWLATLKELNAKDAFCVMLNRLVAEQALDDGIWFVAETASEAYLQAQLRILHSAIEGGVKFTNGEFVWSHDHD